MFTRSEITMLELYTACILFQYHWDKVFHFPGKFHFLVKTFTDSIRLGVVYSNIVLYNERGYVLWNKCTVWGPHHPDPQSTTRDLFIYFIFNFFNRSSILNPRSPIPDPLSSILDPRSSILDPRFPVNLDVLLIKMVLSFFYHWIYLFF